MSADLRLPPRAWLIVGLLWVVACLNYLDRIMLTTMRESLIEAIPMTDAQFGLLTSAFLWVYGLLSPFAGFLADRFSRSRVIIGSLFVWSAIIWLTGHAKTYEQLLVARALMGISEACYIPASLALIIDYHRGPTRSLVEFLEYHAAVVKAHHSAGHGDDRDRGDEGVRRADDHDRGWPVGFHAGAATLHLPDRLRVLRHGAGRGNERVPVRRRHALLRCADPHLHARRGLRCGTLPH